MRKIIMMWLLCMPFIAMAQNTTSNDKVAALQAEAAAKAQAAQEAAKAAQEAARLAQEAAEAAAAEAARVSQEEPRSNWQAAPVEPQPATTAAELKRTEREETANANAPYLAEDAVPLVAGKVQWTKDISVPGKTARQLYDLMLRQLTTMTQAEGQLERSKVALINEAEHKMAATFQQWIVFSNSFLSLDRSKINYLLMAECSDGHVQLTFDHITYNYPTQKETVNYQAEKWIVDKYSVNKKRTRLLPMSGKFRRKTIDLKNQVFKEIEAALK